MPYVYFNAYNTVDGFDDYQRTGSTATWIDNDDTSQFSAYTGINEFWPSPSAGDAQETQNFIICWCDNSVANTTTRDGVTSKVSYWSVPYSNEDANYLDWLNEAIRCTGGTGEASLSLALGTAVNRGIWTNYNTDITPGFIS